ncbi:transmembrane protein 191C isoform X1 [Camelus dromedarius]|uniref:transmembrane protein 191C isoform X1 n=1 Tax=Camelus dromedarius TaxID=9838 RepID=UPI003119613A
MVALQVRLTASPGARLRGVAYGGGGQGGLREPAVRRRGSDRHQAVGARRAADAAAAPAGRPGTAAPLPGAGEPVRPPPRARAPWLGRRPAPPALHASPAAGAAPARTAACLAHHAGRGRLHPVSRVFFGRRRGEICGEKGKRLSGERSGWWRRGDAGVVVGRRRRERGEGRLRERLETPGRGCGVSRAEWATPPVQRTLVSRGCRTLVSRSPAAHSEGGRIATKPGLPLARRGEPSPRRWPAGPRESPHGGSGSRGASRCSPVPGRRRPPVVVRAHRLGLRGHRCLSVKCTA